MKILANLYFHLQLLYRLYGVQIRSQFQYRTAFVLELLATMLTLSLYFIAFALVLQRFGPLGGWTLAEVAFLWGSVELAFGMMDMIFAGFDPQGFGEKVRRGTFDQLLLRPINITIQVLGSQLLLRRLGRIAQGAAILTFALANLHLEWTMLKVIYFGVVQLSMIGFFGGLFIVGSTITFWTIDSIEAMNVLTYGSSELIAYPMHIYPAGLRHIFTFIVPAMFLNYAPALYFLGKTDPHGLPVWTAFLAPLVGVGTLTLALAFWRLGLKHYQSTGS